MRQRYIRGIAQAIAQMGAMIFFMRVAHFDIFVSSRAVGSRFLAFSLVSITCNPEAGRRW